MTYPISNAADDADPALQFYDTPLAWIDEALRGGRDAFWLPDRRLCVAHPSIARDILRNAGELYVEHSDFFDTAEERFDERAAQIEIAHEARVMFEHRWRRCDPAAMVRSLPGESVWPQTAVELIMALGYDTLAAPQRSKRFHAALRAVIQQRIVEREPEQALSLKRFTRRLAYLRAFAAERSSLGAEDGSLDVLGLVAKHAPETGDAHALKIYSAFVFALLSSTALALSWSLLLALSHGADECEPRSIVTEALRLYPIAWFLERRPACAHAILDAPVTPHDRVVVCPYAIHRNPRFWDAAHEFRPERWKDNPDRSAWLPFGSGPHMCVAVSFTMSLVSAVLEELLRARPSVELLQSRPLVSASLVPPRFTLRLRRA